MESAIALFKQLLPQPETILVWAALIVAGFVIANLADRLTAWTLRHEFDDDEQDGDDLDSAALDGDKLSSPDLNSPALDEDKAKLDAAKHDLSTPDLATPSDSGSIAEG